MSQAISALATQYFIKKSPQMTQYSTIVESNNFIVLDKYTKYSELNEAPIGYQTEAALEKEFI